MCNVIMTSGNMATQKVLATFLHVVSRPRFIDQPSLLTGVDGPPQVVFEKIVQLCAAHGSVGKVDVFD